MSEGPPDFDVIVINERIFGCIYPDNTSLFIGVDAEGTLSDITRFSVKDARTFEQLARTDLGKENE